MKTTQHVVLDLQGCCLTLNYWQETLIPYWCENMAPFIQEQSTAPMVQEPLRQFAQAQSIDSNNLADCCEHLIRSIEENQWPPGLALLISQLTTIGLTVGFLEPQVHADTISSIHRWHSLNWQVTVLSPLTSVVQRLLLDYCQSPTVAEQVHCYQSLAQKSPFCMNSSITEALLNLKQEKQGSFIWITCQPQWLEPGLKVGYQCFHLDRQCTAIDNKQATNTRVIMDLSLIDLLVLS